MKSLSERRQDWEIVLERIISSLASPTFYSRLYIYVHVFTDCKKIV